MDSLLASYASSDEEDERSQQENPPKGREQVGEDLVPKAGGFLASLPPPKSSSSLFSSLPPPKPKVQNPISSTSSGPKNPQKTNEEDEQQLQGNREDSAPPPSLPRPSSSLFSSLPQPKPSSSSLFSSLPSPKIHTAERQILPLSSSASPAPAPKKVVQFRPPTMNLPVNVGAEDEEDEDEDEKEKQRKKSESLIQTSSVKSFLSSIPKPKNSMTLGALPSASGTGRRSMLETEVPGSNDSDIANAGTGSIASFNGGYDRKSADNKVSVTSTSGVSGSSDHVPGGDYSSWGSGSENYVSYDGYNGYGNSGVTGEDYSNLGGGTVDHANYGNSYGSYADYGQYQSNWTDGSTASAAPQMSGSAENVLRMPGKRSRNDAPAEIVEVKQDELMKNRPRQDQVKLTGIAFGPAYQPASTKGKPTKLHKRKHQIGSLFYDMKQKETELAERRAQGFLTKAQTQGKYGW